MSTVSRSGGAAFAAGASALLLVVSGLAFAANFVYADFLAGRDDNAREAAAELQVGSQQLAKFAQLAVSGDDEAYDAFIATRQRIDKLVAGLEKGDGSLGVRGYKGDLLEVGVASSLEDVAGIWRKMSMDADRIVQGREQVIAMHETANAFNIRIPQVSAQLAEVVRGMSDDGAAPSQINLANRQIVLADRMSRRVTEVMAGGDVAVTAADALQRDAHVFGVVLRGLRVGEPEDGLVRVNHPAAVAALDKVDGLHRDATREIEALLQGSTDLAEVQLAARTLVEDSDVMLEASRELSGAFGSSLRRPFPNTLLGLFAGAIAALSLIVLLASVQQMRRELSRRP